MPLSATLTRRSQAVQMIHYLARPHRGRPSGPVGGAAAFTRESLAREGGFHVTITDDERAEILAAFRSPGGSDRAPHWPRFAALLTDARHVLAFGRGFVVLRGIPVDALGEEASSTFFCAVGRVLGVPGAQNPEGDLLGHVRDEGGRTADTRLYRTNAEIAFHCDAADVVGLLCLEGAAHGGRSRLASSVTVHDRLLTREPALVGELFHTVELDTRAESGLRHFPVQPSCWDGKHLRTFYHSDYFRSVERLGPSLRLRDATRALLDAYDALALENCVEMDLLPGDLQLVSNHVVVHGRSAYEDVPGRKRHLLRLWLSLPGRMGAGGALGPTLGVLGRIARGRLGAA